MNWKDRLVTTVNVFAVVVGAAAIFYVANGVEQHRAEALEKWRAEMTQRIDKILPKEGENVLVRISINGLDNKGATLVLLDQKTGEHCSGTVLFREDPFIPEDMLEVGNCYVPKLPVRVFAGGHLKNIREMH